MFKWSTFKVEIIALAILLPLAFVLTLVISHWPKEDGALVLKDSASVQSAVSVSPAPEIIEEESLEKTITSSGIVKPEIAVEIVGVKDAKNISVATNLPSSVASIMEQAGANGQMALETKDFGGSLGLFIESINGVKNDPATSTYWQLYINGKKSALGASSVIVNKGDVISWHFEQSSKE